MRSLETILGTDFRCSLLLWLSKDEGGELILGYMLDLACMKVWDLASNNSEMCHWRAMDFMVSLMGIGKKRDFREGLYHVEGRLYPQ